MHACGNVCPESGEYFSKTTWPRYRYVTTKNSSKMLELGTLNDPFRDLKYIKLYIQVGIIFSPRLSIGDWVGEW